MLEVMDALQIKRLRIEFNISILEIAALTGLPSGFIEQIESETIPVLESDLERITSVLQTLVEKKLKNR